MTAKTTMEIARRYAEAFRSPQLDRWALDRFGKSFAVSVGADMRRPPEESDAPFAVVFVDGRDEARGHGENLHSLGLLVGISDEAWKESGNVRVLSGLEALASDLWPMLREAFTLAVPGVVLSRASIEYDIFAFPLCMLNAELECEEKLPIGRR